VANSGLPKLLHWSQILCSDQFVDFPKMTLKTSSMHTKFHFIAQKLPYRKPSRTSPNSALHNFLTLFRLGTTSSSPKKYLTTFISFPLILGIFSQLICTLLVSRPGSAGFDGSGFHPIQISYRSCLKTARCCLGKFP
jgi:hypothetical protein